MCNNCIHAPVCGKCKATGGHVGKCEHFWEERKGRWLYNLGNPSPYCSRCGSEPNHSEETKCCPNCGARMGGDHHA